MASTVRRKGLYECDHVKYPARLFLLPDVFVYSRRNWENCCLVAVGSRNPSNQNVGHIQG